MARCLVSVMRALGQLPALHFHHTLTGICPQVVDPSPLGEQRVLAYMWAGCEAPARRGEGRLDKRPRVGLGKGRRRVSYSSYPTLFKPRSLLRGSRRLVMGP